MCVFERFLKKNGLFGVWKFLQVTLTSHVPHRGVTLSPNFQIQSYPNFINESARKSASFDVLIL